MQDVFHLAAIGSGVHIDGTAQCSRDTIREFQTGQLGAECFAAEGRKPRACTGADEVFFLLDAVVQGRDINDCTTVASILKENIAAVAEQLIFDTS